MDTSKIIKGVVSNGRYTVTAPIVKEDYGLYLQIEGVELPSTYEVDFSNSENSGTSVTMIGNADGVLIPRQFIDSGKDVFAFLYHVGEDFGRTVYKFRIPNKVRPDRTNEEPTPEEQSAIDQAISALNDAVEQTTQDVASADQSAQSAKEDADRAEQAKTGAETAQRKAEEAQGYAERAKDDAETSERNASESERKAKGYADTASEKADAITGLTATAQTLPDGSSATANYNPETGVMSFGIPRGKDGTNGDDGYSPTANVSKSGKTATITITDKNGTTSAQVEDGTDGTDGISPTVTITPIIGGHRITITDADGEHSADVMDGTGNVDDVQINGSSIVNDGVANIPYATASSVGVVRTSTDKGTQMLSGNILGLKTAESSNIKTGTNAYRPIVPNTQHESTFYGLAKSAGDTTQSQSSNAVGNYTDEAKAKIQDMIGIDDWQLVAEETLSEDGGFDITIANSAREVYIYAEIEIASSTTSLVVEAYSDSGTRVYYQTFGGQINSSKKAITVVQLIPIATEIKSLVYLGKDVYTNSGHFDWQHKSFNVGKLNRFRITAYGSIIQIPTGSIVRIFAR